MPHVGSGDYSETRYNYVSHHIATLVSYEHIYHPAKRLGRSQAVFGAAEPSGF